MMNCWAKTVKVVQDLQWDTAQSVRHSSIREDLLSRWPKFLRSLLSGPSPEAATLARVAAAHRRNTTAANHALLLATTGLSAWTTTVEWWRFGPIYSIGRRLD